jgi:hypothetical protein
MLYLLHDVKVLFTEVHSLFWLFKRDSGYGVGTAGFAASFFLLDWPVAVGEVADFHLRSSFLWL